MKMRSTIIAYTPPGQVDPVVVAVLENDLLERIHLMDERAEITVVEFDPTSELVDMALHVWGGESA